MGKVDSSCAECGIPLKRWPSRLKPVKYGPFCGRICLGAYRTKHLVGDLGSNFRNGMKWDRKYIAVKAPWHPNKVASEYVYLHRLIAEARLGRFLRKDEIVHHRDENPMNNHWSNLEVMTQADHAKSHIKERNEYGQFQNEKRHDHSPVGPEGEIISSSGLPDSMVS